MENAVYRKIPNVVSGTPAVSGGFVSSLLRGTGVLMARLAARQSEAAERRKLRNLTDYQLRDIGLTRDDVEEMARRPVWSRPV